MNAFLLNALQHYGYLALWLIVFFAAAGAPISGSLLLSAAGAFAALGDLNIFILFPLALSAAVMGDNLGYFIGRRVGTALLTWLAQQKRFRWITPESLDRARVYFRRRAGWTIFITRFLIVVLGGSINFLAGLEEYPYQRFLFWDVSGQILGALISLGMGYLFAASWEEVAGLFGAFSSLVLALLVACILSAFLFRKIRQQRHVRATQTSTDETNTVKEMPQLLESIPKRKTGHLPISD
ncbi:MAG: DedA family protein [Ktedonobacteraceae bacterium]|nr:DedA family protein [Ktedonobacteraceae bacterium]